MDTLIIGIAGGTGSGKSTFTNRIKEQFPGMVSVLYHDNYYRRRDSISFEERKKINYDHPDSLETDLMIEHLKKLRAGEPILCPVYDFTRHNRSEKTEEVLPAPIILAEGILVLQNEELRNLFDIRIYVEADADERILRRVLRDTRERGRDLEGIISQYLNTVKPMHNLYVEPSKVYADLILNGGRNPIAYDMVATKIRSFLSRSETTDREGVQTDSRHS